MSSAREIIAASLCKSFADGIAHADTLTDAILRALDAAGYAVVPKVATRTMLLGGHEALERGEGLIGAWRAMVAAAGSE